MTEIGVGPHPQPIPTDPQFDPELLADGDRRNVADKYRYWRVDAIIDDLDAQGVALEIAIENLERDFNMGTIVRSANAFGVRHVHIIGRRQWNRRGAMKTETYLHVHYYQTPDEFIQRMHLAKRQVIAIDIVDGAEPIEEIALPERSVLLFGQEGPGLSATLLAKSDRVAMISQKGSTRSLNVGVAAGIAMHMWTVKHR